MTCSWGKCTGSIWSIYVEVVSCFLRLCLSIKYGYKQLVTVNQFNVSILVWRLLIQLSTRRILQHESLQMPKVGPNEFSDSGKSSPDKLMLLSRKSVERSLKFFLKFLCDNKFTIYCSGTFADNFSWSSCLNFEIKLNTENKKALEHRISMYSFYPHLLMSWNSEKPNIDLNLVPANLPNFLVLKGSGF